MMVLVTYDVNTTDPAGRRRLRQVARICRNHGIRVQNSVFECHMDPAERVALEDELRVTIDKDRDSIRIYDLGSMQPSKITHMGTKIPLDVDGDIIF